VLLDRRQNLSSPRILSNDERRDRSQGHTHITTAVYSLLITHTAFYIKTLLLHKQDVKSNATQILKALLSVHKYIFLFYVSVFFCVSPKCLHFASE
jgi:hypothetical protein